MKNTVKKSGLDRLLQKASGDPDTLAVILFGSVARDESSSLSDMDICIILNKKYDPAALSQKKLEYLSVADSDISIYQQLPLYIRHRVLKEGRVLFCRNDDMLYELAFKTVKEFEDFKPLYYEYLEEVARG